MRYNEGQMFGTVIHLKSAAYVFLYCMVMFYFDNHIGQCCYTSNTWVFYFLADSIILIPDFWSTFGSVGSKSLRPNFCSLYGSALQ